MNSASGIAQSESVESERLATASSGGMPAWVLSVLIHVVLFAVLAIFVRGQVVHGLAEGERVGGIVLAQRQSDESVEYFDESDSTTHDAAQPNAVADTLPPLAAADSNPLNLPDLALPGQTLPTPSDVLVAQPNAQAAGRARIAADDGIEDILAEDAARRRSATAYGPPTQVRLFGGAPAVGSSFVFVIDRSKSMGNEGLGAIHAAQKELTAALAGLESRHRFQIVGYHHQRVFMNNEAQLLAATDSNKQRIKPFLNGLAAFGGTNHEMGLIAAMQFDPDVIFLLTDGGDPGLSETQLRRIEQRTRRGQTTIHCVQFGFGPLQDSDTFMNRLAQRTGGSFRYVDMSGRR